MKTQNQWESNSEEVLKTKIELSLPIATFPNYLKLLLLVKFLYYLLNFCLSFCFAFTFFTQFNSVATRFFPKTHHFIFFILVFPIFFITCIRNYIFSLFLCLNIILPTLNCICFIISFSEEFIDIPLRHGARVLSSFPWILLSRNKDYNCISVFS